MIDKDTWHILRVHSKNKSISVLFLERVNKENIDMNYIWNTACTEYNVR